MEHFCPSLPFAADNSLTFCSRCLIAQPRICQRWLFFPALPGRQPHKPAVPAPRTAPCRHQAAGGVLIASGEAVKAGGRSRQGCAGLPGICCGKGELWRWVDVPACQLPSAAGLPQAESIPEQRLGQQSRTTLTASRKKKQKDLQNNKC